MASPIASAAMQDLDQQIAFRVAKMQYDATKQHAEQLIQMVRDLTQIQLGQPMAPLGPSLGQNVHVFG